MNAAARDARHAGGALSASGGCGEIYRNFFFLPDRPVSAGTVARSFFARFAPGDATGLFDQGASSGRSRTRSWKLSAGQAIARRFRAA